MNTIEWAVGITMSVLIYFAGVQRGKLAERRRKDHEQKLMQANLDHQTELELQRQQKELKSKVADEYVQMSRTSRDNGPHALASLGLDLLPDDRSIRESIHEMHVRTGKDPWQGHSHLVEDLDLAQFFAYIRKNRINFFNTPLHVAVEQCKSQKIEKTA